MTVNDKDVSALAYLATRIRQETTGCGEWNPRGTQVVFGRVLPGKHLVTAIELVVTHGQDPEARTPEAVTRPFTPTNLGAPIRPRCEKHRSQYADDCGQCDAEDRYANGASDTARADGFAACKAAIDASKTAAQASTETEED